MPSNNRRIVFVVLLFAILLAAFLRFWRLDVLPPGLYHDEAYNGLDALSLIQGKTFPQFYEGWELYAEEAHAGRPPFQTRFPVFFEGNYGREPLHIYLMALSILLFDATPFAIRAVPAAAGTLAVLTTFLATRVLFSSKSYFLPIFAALTMAVLYPTVHFSRFGIRAMVFVPIETLAVAFFWMGIHREQQRSSSDKVTATWLWFLLAGVLLGLSFYTFAAARLFPLIWVLFTPLWFWIDRKAFRRFWRQIAGMASIAFLTALPLLWFFAQYPYFFIFRIAYVANKGKGAVEGKPWLTWLFNIGRVIRGLLVFGETHLRHNLPGRPYLDWIQASLFVVGFLRILRNVVRPRYLFLFLWFAVMLLPSILSGDAPHFGRMSGAAAPVSILVAFGAEFLVGIVANMLQRWFSTKISKTAAYGLITLLFLSSVFLTISDYFGRYAREPKLAEDFYQMDWQMGLSAARNGQNADIYLTPTQEELATILFALADPDRLRNYDGGGNLVPAGKEGKAAFYLVRQNGESLDTLEELQEQLPGGSLLQEGLGYQSFSVPKDSPRNPSDNMVNARFSDHIRLLGWSRELDDRNLILTLVWQAEKKLEKDYTAFVHMVDGDSRLVAQLDRQPEGYPTSDWRTGEIVIDRFILELPEDFSPEDNYSIITGFYYLPTLERLGEVILKEEK